MVKEDIDDILLELIDEGWAIEHMTSKESANQIWIRKNEPEPVSKYSKDSLFRIVDIEHILNRIDSMVKIVGYKVATNDSMYQPNFGDYFTGIWNKGILKKLEGYNEILDLKIYYIIKEDVIKKYKDFIKEK
jgi:hypothetical protein